MVRTKGDGGAARTVASKAPRKNLGGGGSSAAARAISAAACASPGGNKYGGGNSYNPQPTPDWQKPLTSFFTRDPNAPPPKMKDEDDLEDETKPVKDKGKGKGKSSKKKGEDVNKEEDEENEPPKKITKSNEVKNVEEGGSSDKSDSSKLQKNGLISDSDED